MADTDLLADLNKVRKVRADVEQVIPLSVIDLIRKKLDIEYLCCDCHGTL